MAKQIKLTQGQWAIVDDEDFPWLSQWKWLALRVNGTEFYAARRSYLSPKRYATVLMHREIVGALGGVVVDHRNGNRMDNRRANLRTATQVGNSANSRKRAGRCSSRFKGVTWDKSRGQWKAGIIPGRKMMSLGRYSSEVNAALAYDAAARELFGKFACVNFPEPGERSALAE